MFFIQFLLLNGIVTEQIEQQEVKRFSIIHGRISTIQVPIQNVFNVEIHHLNKTLNNTKEGEEPSVLFADFCQAKNPQIYLEHIQSINVCADQCEIIIQNNKIYSLLPGYLKVLEMNDEQGFTFFSETLFQISQNLSEILITTNIQQDNKLIILDGVNLFIINIDQNDEINKPIKLQTQIEIVTQIIYYDNLIYVFGNNTLEIFIIQDKQVDLIQSINIAKFENQNTNIMGVKLKSANHFIWITESSLGSIQLDAQFQPIKYNSFLRFEGKIIDVEIYEDLTYVIQKLNNKLNLQYVLEYEGDILKQNLTLTTKVHQIFSTQNYIIILQENLIQLAFAKIETQQLFSKNILENTNKILRYDQGQLIVQQQNEIVQYEIKQQSAQLVCEPNQNYSTGTYMMELRTGYFVNETKAYHNQLVEINVYFEIFENGNVGLYVGLTIGLAMTFMTMIIFCVFFYKLKAKYQSVREQYHKNSTEFTIE
ncbi:unnamed protein product [Paramecium pentaurelia]|uniref:Transmembrane protein n=1 Tax=Paramecium pentaurelia TaxID=43138 RepID=A0A8S1TVD1_9CILI|nr:unnamed protein product [Paramecium pentaurelia]